MPLQKKDLQIVMIIQAPHNSQEVPRTQIPKLLSLSKTRSNKVQGKCMEHDLEHLQEYYLTLEDLRQLLKIQNDCQLKFENGSKKITQNYIDN